MELSTRSLIKICLIGFLLTFVTIFYIEDNFELKYSDIDSITIKQLDKNIRVNAEITKSSIGGNNVFLEIRGANSTLKGVIFNSNSTPEDGENYSIEGTVKTYKGDIELIVKRIDKNSFQ